MKRRDNKKEQRQELEIIQAPVTNTQQQDTYEIAHLRVHLDVGKTLSITLKDGREIEAIRKNGVLYPDIFQQLVESGIMTEQSI